MSRSPLRLRWLILALVFLLLVFGIPYRFWLSAAGRALVSAEPPVKSDLVVVLAGDFTGNRILTAAALVRQGLAPVALVSGPGEVYGLHESDLAIPFAVRHGFPSSYFVAFPHDATSTVAEAKYVVEELHRRHLHRVELVTSNYHTRRARAVFEAAAPDLEFHMASAPDPYFTPDGWWRNREGRKTFFLEWTKTVTSWIGM